MSSSDEADDDFRPALEDEDDDNSAGNSNADDDDGGDVPDVIVVGTPSPLSAKATKPKKKAPARKQRKSKARPVPDHRKAVASACVAHLFCVTTNHCRVRVVVKKAYLSSDSEDNAPVFRHRRPASASSSADGATAVTTSAARPLLTEATIDNLNSNGGAAVVAKVMVESAAAQPPPTTLEDDVEQAWAQLKTAANNDDEPHLDVEALKAAAAGVAEPGKNKVVITEIFDYAGEAVQVTRAVDADALKRKSTGLEDVVGGLRKKKLSSMSKSHIDWESFKDQEGLQDELRLAVNAGGHLDKEDFLQRTDLRQFANERDVREVERQRRTQQRPS